MRVSLQLWAVVDTCLQIKHLLERSWRRDAGRRYDTYKPYRLDGYAEGDDTTTECNCKNVN